MVIATSYCHLMEAASTLKSVKRGASPGMERHSEDREEMPGLGRQLGAAVITLVWCSAPSVPQPVFTITEKAPTRADTKVIRDGRVS